MIIKYQYKGKIYNDFNIVRKLLPNVSFPANVRQEHLTPFEISIIEEEIPLEVLKKQKLEEIDVWTANKITGGFVSDCNGVAVKYDSDKDTQITMQGIALNMANIATKYPSGIPVRGYVGTDKAKTKQYLNGEQILQWGADLSLHIGKCKEEGWAKQEQVEKAIDKESLDLIILE